MSRQLTAIQSQTLSRFREVRDQRIQRALADFPNVPPSPWVHLDALTRLHGLRREVLLALIKNGYLEERTLTGFGPEVRESSTPPTPSAPVTLPSPHRRVLAFLRGGVILTTLDTGRPTFYADRKPIGVVRPKTLAQMEEQGLIHHTYRYVGDGSATDTWWHLGPGPSDELRWCPSCKDYQCSACHPCFQES